VRSCDFLKRTFLLFVFFCLEKPQALQRFGFILFSRKCKKQSFMTFVDDDDGGGGGGSGWGRGVRVCVNILDMNSDWDLYILYVQLYTFSVTHFYSLY